MLAPLQQHHPGPLAAAILADLVLLLLVLVSALHTGFGHFADQVLLLANPAYFLHEYLGPLVAGA